MNLGPYYITNLVQLIGPLKAVTAMASAGFKSRTIGDGPREGKIIPVDTPTNIHVVLEFQSGAFITLGASWDVWAHRHKNMKLYGSKVSLYIPDPNFFGGEVFIADEEGDAVEITPREPPFSVNYVEDSQRI